MEETKYEKLARKQREVIEALQKAIMETQVGKFLEWCVESLNRFLTKYAPDRLPVWVKIALYIPVLLAVWFAIYGGR